MNRKGSVALIILIVIIILLIAGGVWYYETHGASPSVSTLNNAVASSTAISITSSTTGSTLAACDQSEKQGENSIPLSGGTSISQNELDTISNTLLKLGLITTSSGDPIELVAGGQTFFVFQSSTSQQMYRATTTDLLSGYATLTPLASVSGQTDSSLWVRAYATGTLIYTFPSNILQAINPQAGQSLWTFSTSTDINNVAISGDGLFVDTFNKYYTPGFIKLDPLTGKTLWQSNVGVLSDVLDDGQFVYTIDDEGLHPGSSTLYQLSDATGQILKTFELPAYSNYDGIDECGGNIYFVQEGLAPQDSDYPITGYARFNLQTGVVTDLGQVQGPAYGSQ